jgi:hypothetical protein
MVVDDYSRFTWALLLWKKSDAFDAAQQLFKKIQIEQNSPIMRIRSDHGREFENVRFEEFCHSYGIQQEFSSPITPQHNGVIELKNSVIQEMARVMIHSKNLAQHFRGEAINTACHIINRVYLRPETNKTPYEIWRGKKPTVKYFRIFGIKCYILRDRENLGKFDSKSDEGIVLGYSTNNHVYRVFNKRTEIVIESINVVIDDEEVVASSEREEIQSIPKEMPTPSANMIKSSSSETPVIPLAADSLPDPPKIVISGDTTSAFEDDNESTNPPKRLWVKLNHPS